MGGGLRGTGNYWEREIQMIMYKHTVWLWNQMWTYESKRPALSSPAPHFVMLKLTQDPILLSSECVEEELGALERAV